MPAIAHLGGPFDRRTGLCGASPCPEMPVQMCANQAFAHVFYRLPSGLYVSVYACMDHAEITVAVDQIFVTWHPVEPPCLMSGSRLQINPGESWCMA